MGIWMEEDTDSSRHQEFTSGKTGTPYEPSQISVKINGIDFP